MKKLTLLIAILLAPAFMSAQQMLSSKEMIGITPILSRYIDLPDDAQRSLAVKLGQMATQNGFGSNSGDFILTANVVTIDKQATATAPVQFIVELEVSVYCLNVTEGVVIDETSFVVKGIGNFENKAQISAINNIKPKAPAVRTFMDNVRGKIIDYYNTRIPALMAKAQSLADRNEYDEALAVLASIPEAVDQYPMVAEQMTAIYMKMIDREAENYIQEAKMYMAGRNWNGALNELSRVDPSSSKYPEVMTLINQIKGHIDAEHDRALAEKMQKYEDDKEAALRSHDLAKQQLDAAKQVGVAKAKTETSVMSKLNDWFLGKFK